MLPTPTVWSHAWGTQSLLLPAGRNLIAPAQNILPHSFGELLLEEVACKAACKAKGLYKSNGEA